MRKTRHRHCERRDAIQNPRQAPGLLRRCVPRNGVFPLAWVVGVALAATPALAAPRTIDDCEAIKDPNAYNLCLASFGPVRGQHGASYPGVAAEGDKSGAAASGGAHRTAKRHAAFTRSAGASVGRRGGRIRMEFTPGR